MKEQILELMHDKNYKAMTAQELAEKLNIDEDKLIEILDEMEEEYLIKKSKKKKYNLLENFNLYVGTIEVKDKGYGFIRSEGFEDDLYVPKELLADSMNNDKVLFTITNEGSYGYKKEALVVEIIERGLKNVIGTIVSTRNGNKRFIPNDKKINLECECLDFSIAVIGDIVNFTIEQYVNASLVRGRVTYIIGNINDAGVDIKTIAYKYGFHQEFPKEVIDEVKGLNIDFTVEAKRRKVINEKVITIDGEDAKDLDDAIAVRRLENGNYFLGVYIADVSYYVTEGSALDKEAFQRGTSCYLVDRVIPMLPHKLSNDLCSLNEKEPKLVLGCEMEIDQDGDICNFDIFEGIIKSTHRMTYKDVNLILEENNEQLIKKYMDIYKELLDMTSLSKILRDSREKRGALDFDIPEARILVDDEGRPIDIQLRTRGIGEKMIEDFMIVANETVATTINNLHLPFMYRIHDEPNVLKLTKFNNIAKGVGYKFNLKKNKISPKAVQGFLKSIKEEDKGLESLLLRMMAKAKYSEKNVGHYGLASKCYTHFTSPIRRYPDLIVHRYLRKYLFLNQVSAKDQDDALQKIIKAAINSSQKERDAIDCEYEVEDMKKAEYMEPYIGEEYEATITSITNFGIFAALDNTIEGFIHISSLDGYFIYEENKMSLISKDKTYRLGDKIKVRVKKASKELKQIDFEIVRSFENGKRNKSYRQKQKSRA